MAERAGGQARRISVDGHPSVYYRFGADGKRQYEITYRDEGGRQRWERVSGNLRAADEALAEIKMSLRDGRPSRPAQRTFEEVYADWQAEHLPGVRTSTRAVYERAMRNYVLPRFGGLKIQRVDEERIARWIREMRSGGRKAWTIRSALTPLRQVMAYAVRQRLIPTNPVANLKRSELPESDSGERRILSKEELARLFAGATPRSRTPLQVLAFTGLRASELLALRWCDVDLKEGVIRVRHQLAADGTLVEPKTRSARRAVHLMPRLVNVVRAHKLASAYSQPGDFVLAHDDGAPWTYPSLYAALKTATKRGKLDEEGKPRPTLHGLRHGFGSILVAQGNDVVYVQRQLGHANPNITLRVYAHEFGAAESAKRAIEALERDFGDALG